MPSVSMEVDRHGTAIVYRVRDIKDVHRLSSYLPSIDPHAHAMDFDKIELAIKGLASFAGTWLLIRSINNNMKTFCNDISTEDGTNLLNLTIGMARQGDNLLLAFWKAALSTKMNNEQQTVLFVESLSKCSGELPKVRP